MNIAVVGATGLVGRMFIDILQERDIPVSNLFPFSSENSSGEKIMFRGEEIEARELSEASFDEKFDFCMLAAGNEVSHKYAKTAVQNGAVVIDNSSAFRQHSDVPLVVPEVNPGELKNHKGIIANPNCCAAPLVVVLKPLMEAFGLKRVVVSTYQSVSGAGKGGIADLESGNNQLFQYPILNNLIPHIDVFDKNGDTGEETKIVEETRKILGMADLSLSATAVRVPVMHSHSLSVNVTTRLDFSIFDVRNILKGSPGLKVVDAPEHSMYPMPLFATGQDLVQVGRLRRDTSLPECLNLWIVCDNIRKGAALNAVQILEMLI